MKVQISISIPIKLLENIEQNIQGKNRSQKIVKCAEEGYRILKEGKK